MGILAFLKGYYEDKMNYIGNVLGTFTWLFLKRILWSVSYIKEIW